ncbi:30S ribosomal protein S8 [archaeon]|nr:30S ribosomal protein S8 [archaeon]
MSHDVVADTLNMIMNAKRAGKKELTTNKYSDLLIRILELAKNKKYVSNYELKDKNLKIIIGKLNECRAIKPRFYAKVEEIEKYIKRFLPSRNFGTIIISTSSGLVTQDEVYEKNIGGSLIAYFY